MLKYLSLLVITILTVLPPALAQAPRSEVSLGVPIELSKRSTFTKEGPAFQSERATLEPSTTYGILVSYRYHFARRHGVEVNYGFSRPTQNYNVVNIATNQLAGGISVQSRVQEMTAAYVFSPMQKSRFHPFLLGGAGVLKFDPTGNSQAGIVGLESQIKTAYLYGGGGELRFTKKFALRVQYRGLIYRPPTFSAFTLVGFGGGTLGHIAEPTIGVAYRF